MELNLGGRTQFAATLGVRRDDSAVPSGVSAGDASVGKLAIVGSVSAGMTIARAKYWLSSYGPLVPVPGPPGSLAYQR